MHFRFGQDMYGVDTVDLLVYTHENKVRIVPMSQKRNEWVCTVTLPRERVVYRYRINGGVIELNDPCADYYMADERDKVWSVREQGVSMETSVRYIKSIIADRVMNDINKVLPKKNLNLRDNREVAAGMKLSDIIGAHVVTAIWYQPDGRVYHTDERTLMSELNVEAEVWFWLRLGDMKARYCKGAWTLEMYVDGYKMVRDNFIIKEKTQEQYIGFTCTA